MGNVTHIIENGVVVKVDLIKEFSSLLDIYDNLYAMIDSFHTLFALSSDMSPHKQTQSDTMNYSTQPTQNPISQSVVNILSSTWGGSHYLPGGWGGRKLRTYSCSK